MPDTHFAFFNRNVRKVAPHCHIHFENNYYSVPFSLIGKEVTIRWNNHILRVVYAGEQVALHMKATGIGSYVTVRSHLPDYKIYSENERQVKYETKMKEIGDDAHEYFRMLLKIREGYWSQTVKGVLGLCEQYGKEAVNQSLKRALYYQADDVTTVRHILEQKLYLMPNEPILPKFIEEEPVMARNLSYYAVIYDANTLPAAA